jgi:hypothetical protein
VIAASFARMETYPARPSKWKSMKPTTILIIDDKQSILITIFS